MQVVKFSSKFCEQIKTLKEKGYSPVKAIVRHIIFWQEKDKDEEIKIFLLDVELSMK